LGQQTLGLFPIKAIKGRQDYRHYVPNLMQFLKW